MKTYFILCALVFALLASNSVQSQNVPRKPYIEETNITRKPIQYDHLAEANVMWAKRIWRKIDLREKINHKFYYPTEEIRDRRSLVQVLIQSVKEGSLTAYDPLRDDFSMVLTRSNVLNKLTYIDTAWMPSADPPYEPKMVIVEEPFDYARVIEVRLMEDWFFDKQRSVMEVRIIGIQLVADNIDRNTGEVRGKEPMFWVYFPEARNIFAGEDVFNHFNGAQRWTLDDVFWKRMFGSYIYKEENVYDRQIADYAVNGIDHLLESERVKEDIFAMEHDLWEY